MIQQRFAKQFIDLTWMFHETCDLRLVKHWFIINTNRVFGQHNSSKCCKSPVVGSRYQSIYRFYEEVRRCYVICQRTITEEMDKDFI